MDIETLRLEAHYTALLNERGRMVLDLHQQLLKLQEENEALKAKLESQQSAKPDEPSQQGHRVADDGMDLKLTPKPHKGR